MNRLNHNFSPKFLHFLWGDLSQKEVKKFSILSCIITIILGNYWMLRVMKNPIFNDLVGMSFQPYAKIFSMLTMVVVMLGYSKLVDLFGKKTLFDIVCAFYAIILMLLSIVTTYPEYFSISNTEMPSLFSWIPGKLIGWFAYFTLESISLITILFWSFVSSTTDTESAKKGYPFMVGCLQIGTISGPFIVTLLAPQVGVPTLILVSSFVVMFIPILIRLYLNHFPSESLINKNKSNGIRNTKTGFLEGLKLIITKPYVMGILVISVIYESINTILEFQMSMIAKDIFTTRDIFATFTGKLGSSINGLAFCFALLGTSFFIRKLGLRICLIAYPVIIGCVLLTLLIVNFIGATNYQTMWSLFTSVLVIKGCSYALNNPIKEIIYIPTSTDIRFKSKGWIETFGRKGSKSLASFVNISFSKNISELFLFGTILSLGIVGGWIIIANMLGKKFNTLQTKRLIIS